MKTKRSAKRSRAFFCAMSLIFLCGGAPTWAENPKPRTYVGSTTCLPCHESEYQNFHTYARKSQSFQSVVKMKKGLTPDELQGCYACHTTGYGKPGGFVSIEQTPELKDAGCEVCHGPGGRHIETQGLSDIIRRVTLDVCKKCHTEERVSAFRYRPLVHGGAH